MALTNLSLIQKQRSFLKVVLTPGCKFIVESKTLAMYNLLFVLLFFFFLLLPFPPQILRKKTTVFLFLFFLSPTPRLRDLQQLSQLVCCSLRTDCTWLALCGTYSDVLCGLIGFFCSYNNTEFCFLVEISICSQWSFFSDITVISIK